MIFVAKINMTLTNLLHAEGLDDKVESETMTNRERYQADCLREKPSLVDLLHYFLMINFGSHTEYR